MTNPFLELETPIYDAAMAAQVLASIFEDAQVEANKRPGGQLILSTHETEMLSFLIYDLCRRTFQTRKLFQTAHDETAEQNTPQAKAA